MPRSRTRVLVVGDAMVDEYVRGTVRRTSPEAPGVPVLSVERREMRLGGAANVALNVARLGGEVSLLGVRGKDSAGSALASLLAREGIRDGLVAIPERPTTRKTRVVAGAGQIVRVDEEVTKRLPEAATRKIVAAVRKSDADVAIISDYAKGVLSPAVVAALVERFGGENIVADIKPAHARLVRGLRLITPNRGEAVAMLGEDPDESRELAARLARKLGCPVAVTLGRGGSAIAEGAAAKLVRPLRVREVDVSGAGDTYTAAATLALAAGASLVDAARAANVAAGLSVTKHGTSPVSAAELRRALRK